MKMENRLELAERELGKSVIRINPFLAQDLNDKAENMLCFGIKNTNQIPVEIFDKLRFSERFLWLTVDKMADKGRSIDTDLINPLTYRVMTGSTSGGPINILKGINDFAIGTDGGGSVIGPAMCCQLPAIIGAGLDLSVKNESLSTGKIKIKGSIGVIAKKLEIAIEVLEVMTGIKLEAAAANKGRIKIAIPKRGTVITPDKKDMFSRLTPYLKSLSKYSYSFEECDFTGIDRRETAIEKIEEAFEKYDADIILTCEGPVDVFGYGETIPQMFGEIGDSLTKNNGKYLLRAANICKTTAITVPTDSIACGLLIIAKHGLENAINAISLAQKLESLVSLPQVWIRYFLTDERFNEGFKL